MPPGKLVRWAVIFYGAMLAIAVGWRWLVAGALPFYADARAAAAGVDWLRDAGAGVLAGVIVVLLSGELTRRTRMGERLARAMAQVIGPLRAHHVVALALASALGEEAFFRGALQPVAGFALASLLFGLAHLVPRREWLPWSAFAFAAGLLLGWLFEATGNLVAPLLTHAVVNGVNLHLLARRYAPQPEAMGVDEG